MSAPPVRVLVVDDSAVVRRILSQGLASDPRIQVVGTAANPYDARDKIVQLRPNVLTLDIEMPRMDGVEFLKRLMCQYPIPAVVVSSLTQRGAQMTFDALSAGAVDVVAKPAKNVSQGLQSMMRELREKVKVASQARLSKRPPMKVFSNKKTTETALQASTDKVIAIGASTGGTEALARLLPSLPPDMAGIVIAQHMPGAFTKAFADRLDGMCSIQVTEARDGDRVMMGRALLAPGGKQLRVIRSGGVYRVTVTAEGLISGHAPSVDALMASAAKSAGRNAVAIMLTGMGKDGAQGMLDMRKAGARTFAQDEASCVVFGMPKAAHENGAVERLLSLNKIPQALQTAIKELRKQTG